MRVEKVKDEIEIKFSLDEAKMLRDYMGELCIQDTKNFFESSSFEEINTIHNFTFKLYNGLYKEL